MSNTPVYHENLSKEEAGDINSLEVAIIHVKYFHLLLLTGQG